MSLASPMLIKQKQVLSFFIYLDLDGTITEFSSIYLFHMFKVNAGYFLSVLPKTANANQNYIYRNKRKPLVLLLSNLRVSSIQGCTVRCGDICV